jgi:GNAT superfamily N-acetyltransferase
MAEAGQPVRIDEVPLGDPRIKDFVAFHWAHYHGNPHWVPQLDADLLGNKLLGMTGLLTPEHPYHQTADATHFMAFHGDKPVGRISAVINHRFNDYYGTKLGFFGFFETIEDYAVAEALLDAAKAWAKAHGAEVLRGPGEYSNATHERQACLIDGFDQDVYVEHTWNPPYYQEFIERYGFTKAMDYVAHMIDLRAPVADRLAQVSTAVRGRGHLETRPLDMSRFDEDLRLVIDIYNQAWAQNWGFLPIEQWEVDALVEALKPIIDPGLVRFAFYKGKAVAVLGAFPDPNYLLQPRWGVGMGNSDIARLARLLTRRRHIPRIRLIFFGIVPGYRRLGADALLYQEVHSYAQAHNYTQCDVSLLLEVNELIIRAAEFMGGEQYKKWRIWDLPL